MPVYNYKARDNLGKSIKGTIGALNREEAMDKLRNLGYMPTKIKELPPGVKAVSFLDKSYGIIFIDPPYSDPYTNSLLTDLSKSKLLESNSAIILCHANQFPLASNYNGLHLTEQRRYGDTYISIFRKED